MLAMIGETVNVIVDRPLGSFHPEYSNLKYTVNYGYIQGLFANDGEEQDVYILGVDEPVESFTGKIIAIIHRRNDNEDKWVAAPEGCSFSKEYIYNRVEFQEKHFDIEILT